MEDLLIKRPCILVHDLARSLTLYQDILGFQPSYQSPAGPDSYLYKLFNLPATAKLTFASCDTPTTPRALALTEVKNISLSFFQAQSRVALVTQVQSVPEVIDAIQKLNLKVLPANQFQTESKLTFTEQGIEDFDGNLLVLYSCHPPNTNAPGE